MEGGGPKDSSSGLKRSGEGVSTSDGSYTDGVVTTEAIVSKEVRWCRRGWRRELALR